MTNKVTMSLVGIPSPAFQGVSSLSRNSLRLMSVSVTKPSEAPVWFALITEWCGEIADRNSEERVRCERGSDKEPAAYDPCVGSKRNFEAISCTMRPGSTTKVSRALEKDRSWPSSLWAHLSTMPKPSSVFPKLLKTPENTDPSSRCTSTL